MMITWEKPIWLLALFAVPLLIAFFVWVQLRRRKMVLLFAAAGVLKDIRTDTAMSRRVAQSVLYVLGFVFVILALAGPKLGYHWQEVHRQGIDLFVALDLSKSMLAEDVKPNRLQRAKSEIADLLDVLGADRVGIIAFSGDSYVACPLTLDIAVARMFLDDLRIGHVERGGTNIGAAIYRALKSFQEPGEGGAQKVMLLVSDGEDLEGRGLAAARKAKEAGVKIFCVGIGSATGAPVALPDEEGHKEFMKDKQGKTVLTKLGGDSLQKIALDTGGAYMQIAGGPFQLSSLYKTQIAKVEKKDMGQTRKKVYESRYQWPLSVALLLVVVGFMMEDRWVGPRWFWLWRARWASTRRKNAVLET